MIIVSGSIAINPDHVERAKELTATLTAATRQEPGNVAYEFFGALDDPGRYHVYEEWESQEAIDAHTSSEHMAAFFAGVAELEIVSVELTQHEVTGSKRIM